LVKAASDCVVARIWLAATALVAGDEVKAASAVSPHLVDHIPRSRFHYGRLAAIHFLLHDYDEALRYIMSAVKLFPTNARIWGLLGEIHRELNDNSAALYDFERRVECAPTIQIQAGALLDLGQALAQGGRKEEAIATYRRVLSLKPHDGVACFALTNCQELSDASDPFISDLRRYLTSPLVPESDKCHIHFALAHVYDRSGDFGLAFAHLHLANDLSARHRFTHEQVIEIPTRLSDIESHMYVFTDKMIASHSSHGFQEEYLIFVVGMPRSGTTLVERILGSHPDACALGERQDIRWLRGTIPSVLRARNGYPKCCNLLTPKLIHEFAELVRKRLSKLAASSSRVVTKLPWDFFELGLIKILFPKAFIIHCIRDPIDTCLSCYMQNFHNLFFATDLQKIADVYKVYRRMMAHWYSVLPPRSLLDVHYEALVEDPETIARTICEFCNIPFHPRCLEFYNHANLVQTASIWQVRRPIYRTSIKRSDRYREFLGPVLELEDSATTDERA